MIKSLLETVLCESGIAAAARSRVHGRTLVLAYHNVVPDAEPVTGESSLHLSLSDFVQHLDFLVEETEVIPVSDVFSDPDDAPENARPRVVITFDDAYRGAVRLGVPELVRRELPATIFVAPGLLADTAFWWDALAPTLDACEWEEFRASALDEHHGRDSEIKEAARRLGLEEKPVPENQRSATEYEVRAATQEPGITLGAHSWSHPNLSALEGEKLEEEVERPARWLRDEFRASSTDFFAFPYGRSNQAARRAARDAGYVGAFSTDGRWLPDDQCADPLNLPRFVIPAGLSPRGFVLRVSGLKRG